MGQMSLFTRKFKRSSNQVEEETALIRNGRIFQEKLIASVDNKHNPIRSFPSDRAEDSHKELQQCLADYIY